MYIVFISLIKIENIFKNIPAEVANDEPFETMTIGCFTDDLV